MNRYALSPISLLKNLEGNDGGKMKMPDTRRACFYCLGIALRAQMLKQSARLLHHIDDRVALASHDRSVVLPYSGHSWCLSSSLSMSIGFPIQDEAEDVDRGSLP